MMKMNNIINIKAEIVLIYKAKLNIRNIYQNEKVKNRFFS